MEEHTPRATTPVSKLVRLFAAVAAGLVMAAVMACGGGEEPLAEAEGTETASPAETAATTTTPSTPEAEGGGGPTPTGIFPLGTTEQPTAADELEAVGPPAPTADYDSTENMFRLFSGPMHDPELTRQAISLAAAHKDKSMVPVLIEMLRFVWGVDLPVATNAAISTITGREYGQLSRAWHEWMEWLAKNADEYAPPDRYLEWKITLMKQIDLRFGEFLAPAAEGSRINLTELAWGGVRPDGIPDLQNPPAVYADEQDYLQPTDRVFGVSINGEHRAYPLRIVNAHEMANDVLGGEPIALAY